MARNAAVRFRLDKIPGVAVNVESHVASLEPDDGVRFHGRVVHEHFCLPDGVSDGRGLFGAYVVERDKHRGVYGAYYVEEGVCDT